MAIIDTLAEAKKRLLKEMGDEGMDCPCCGRFAKLYANTISKGQMSAFTWIVLHSKYGQRWVHVQDEAPKWLLRSNTHGKLVHWGLLETQLNRDTAIRTPGIWAPTTFGMRFFRGDETVKKYAMVFDNSCLYRRGPDLSYSDVFDKFNYNELMATAAKDVD